MKNKIKFLVDTSISETHMLPDIATKDYGLSEKEFIGILKDIGYLNEEGYLNVISEDVQPKMYYSIDDVTIKMNFWLSVWFSSEAKEKLKKELEEKGIIAIAEDKSLDYVNKVKKYCRVNLVVPLDNYIITTLRRIKDEGERFLKYREYQEVEVRKPKASNLPKLALN
jgi:hypothetical protein